MIMLPAALSSGIFMAIGGRLFDKIGAKPLLVPGVCLLIFATFSLSHISLDMPLKVIIFPVSDQKHGFWVSQPCLLPRQE